jgi:hypothetical protein
MLFLDTSSVLQLCGPRDGWLDRSWATLSSIAAGKNLRHCPSYPQVHTTRTRLWAGFPPRPCAGWPASSKRVLCFGKCPGASSSTGAILPGPLGQVQIMAIATMKSSEGHPEGFKVGLRVA